MALDTVAGEQLHPSPRTAGNQSEAAFRGLGKGGKTVCGHIDRKIAGCPDKGGGLC